MKKYNRKKASHISFIVLLGLNDLALEGVPISLLLESVKGTAGSNGEY